MVSLVSSYRALPALAGSSFLPIAFLARLPSSMVQIGTVVLVSTTYSSVAAGGLAAAGLAVGSAVGGPVIGMLADRIGQRPIVLAASLLNAAATLALVFLVTGLAPTAAVLAVAALAGASTPQIGPLVRTRWVAMTQGSRQGGDTLSTAMSYEGAADETAYIFGPAVVSLLAAVASPSTAMIMAALLVGVFGVLVALHPTAVLVPPAAKVAGQSVWSNPRVIALALAGMAIGAFFGSMQTAVTAVATAAGVAGAAGAIYAVMGVGSAVAALASASLPARFSLTNRLRVFAAASVLLIAPLLLVDSVVGLMIFILPLGVVVGPYIITMYTMGEKVAPAGRMSAVMTLLASGLVIGYSIGSSVGGQLAEHSGARAGFLAAMVAMAFGTVVAMVIRANRNH